MDIFKIFSIMLALILYFSNISCQSFQPSSLERFLPQFRLYRQILAGTIGRTSENVANMRLAKKLNMLQEEIPATQPFPCNVTGFRSAKPPTSVHQLRPGDIDVVGALGDSLTAGFGLVATNIIQVFMENRGLSWSIGGQGTWRQYLTLPNILKEFNPNLIGYSLRDSFADDRNSQFNPAEGAAISSELPYMAKILLKRILNDKRVNLKKDWKMITIMIGANDFCLDICFQNNMTTVLEMHRKDMITVLRLLRDNLPRTIINLVPPPHLQTIVELKQVPEICQVAHPVECYCLFQDRFTNNLQMYYDIMLQWQKMDQEISKMPEFHQNDFTIVYQPFIVGVKIPLTDKGTDWSFMSSDCFHLSQKMNARAANGLWNNMLERVGEKSNANWIPLYERFLCPSKENPYIFTSQNS